MPKDWKRAYATLKTERDFLKEKADETAFALVKLKDLHRRTCAELQSANVNLKRAQTSMRAAAETFTGCNHVNSAELLMIAANDIAPPARASGVDQDQCGNG